MTLNVPKEVSADFLSQPVNLLLFRLGRQTFALTIEHIIQIIPMLKLTPVPQVEQIIEGVANIHGKVTPILSARRFLGMPQIPFDLDTPIILCEANQTSMGLIVDEVQDVISILESQIAPTKNLLPNGANTTRSISGVIYQGERLILLLSPEFLLNPGQVNALDQVINALPPAQAQPSGEPAPQPDEPNFAVDMLAEPVIPEPFSEQPEVGFPAMVWATEDEAIPASQNTPETADTDASASAAESTVTAEAETALADAEPAVTEPTGAEAKAAETASLASTGPESSLPVDVAPQVEMQVSSVDSSAKTTEEPAAHPEPQPDGKKPKANGKRAARQTSAKKASASRDEIIAGHLASISWDMPPADCSAPDEPEDHPNSQTSSDN